MQLSATAPAAPVVTAAPGAAVGTIALSWPAVAGASFYSIDQGDAAGAETLLVETALTAYTAKNLTPGKVYYFRVKAVAKDASGADIIGAPAEVHAVAKVVASTGGTTTTTTTTTAAAGSNHLLLLALVVGGYYLSRRKRSS